MTMSLFGDEPSPVHNCAHAWERHVGGACTYPGCTCGPIPPPIVGRDDPENSHTAARLIDPTRGSKRAAVLDLLRQGGWVTAERLREVGGGQGDRRMRELRQMGYSIEAKAPSKGTSWSYRLLP